jgi:hypothetical protein
MRRIDRGGSGVVWCGGTGVTARVQDAGGELDVGFVRMLKIITFLLLINAANKSGIYYTIMLQNIVKLFTTGLSVWLAVKALLINLPRALPRGKIPPRVGLKKKKSPACDLRPPAC